MKTKLRLALVSSLIITGGTLFSVSANGGNNGNSKGRLLLEDAVYMEDEYTIAEKALKNLQRSTMALENIMNNPETGIPSSLISQSEGIVIFPAAFKLALGTAGGQGGRGVAMIRHDDGSWSNPFFVTLGEGSVGIQIGVQKSGIVLIFKNKDDILAIDQADIVLGGDVGVAAGPVSKGTSAMTDIKFDAEIYSYQQSKGLFAGISLKGGIMGSNNSFNESLYGWDEVNSDDIFNRIQAPYNDEVCDLIETLDMYGK